MSWFRKRSPQPPPRLNTLVAYNHIADAIEAECRAMGLPGDKFVLVGVHTAAALEPPDVVYDLRRTQDAVWAGCRGAGLSPTETSSLAGAVTNRLLSAPIMVRQGHMLAVLAEEAIALKIDPMKLPVLPTGVLHFLVGEEAGRAWGDRLIEMMKAKEEGRPAPPYSPDEAAAAETPHDLDKIIGALLSACVTLQLDLMTMFMLGKHLTFRLGGQEAGKKYQDKVTGLIELTQAVQKIDKACR